MSLGAGVFESYNTDPLTLAAKRAVDAGIVVVAAAGNYGKAKNGQTQYGAIGAPGNAPWVLTVGASSTEGTTDRRDDKMAGYSSRGPTMIDFGAKPDLVAPGTGTVSLATQDSLFYVTKAAFLVPGKRAGLGLFQPYLTLSGTSMATPVVAGTVALMLEANPDLTPNMVKAILQFTAEEKRNVSYLAQGAGFLNTLGAVRLARFFAHGEKGDAYPSMTVVEPSHPVGQPPRQGRRAHAWRHGMGPQHRAGAMRTPRSDRTSSGVRTATPPAATTSSGATTLSGARATTPTTSCGATPMTTTSSGATAMATTSSGATAATTTSSGATTVATTSCGATTAAAPIATTSSGATATTTTSCGATPRVSTTSCGVTPTRWRTSCGATAPETRTSRGAAPSPRKTRSSSTTRRKLNRSIPTCSTTCSKWSRSWSRPRRTTGGGGQ